jgi:hypothetical protein
MIFDSTLLLHWPKISLVQGLGGPTQINPSSSKIFPGGDVNVKKRRGVSPFRAFSRPVKV